MDWPRDDDDDAARARAAGARQRRARGGGADLNAARRLEAHIQIAETGAVVANPWRASAASACAHTTVYFDDLLAAAAAAIERFGAGRVAVGCVAWLSEPRILTALRLCRAVFLVVNDEDYATWGGGGLLRAYAALPESEEPLAALCAALDTPLAALPAGAAYEPVRAYGGRDALMHSKYLVFLAAGAAERGPAGAPVAVWTGSMNWTRRAGRNVENALLLEDAALARAYFDDFANTFLQSRPLRAGPPQPPPGPW